MSTFENQMNGYRESVTLVGAFVLTLLFGGFYLIYRGAWNYAVVSLLAAAATFGIAWFVIPFFSYRLIKASYQQRGWKLVEEV